MLLFSYWNGYHFISLRWDKQNVDIKVIMCKYQAHDHDNHDWIKCRHMNSIGLWILLFVQGGLIRCYISIFWWIDFSFKTFNDLLIILILNLMIFRRWRSFNKIRIDVFLWIETNSFKSLIWIMNKCER